MRIGVDMGHTLTGTGTGAVGYVKETDKNREVGKRLIEILRAKGHSVYNCTVDKSENDLADRVALANKQDLDLFISLHLNAYVKTENPMGVETYIWNGSWNGKEPNRAIALRVNNKLANSIGWKNRGVKEANYYVLRNTKAPAILVELGFCDSRYDMNLWNTEKIAIALFEAITNTTYTSTSSNNTSSSTGSNTASKGLVRVKKDGVQVGAYSKDENMLNAVKKCVTEGFTVITIERV